MNDLPTSDELALWSRAFELSDPRDVIGWSLAVYGIQLTLGTGFGASGMVLLDMALRVKRDIDVFFIDTGLLFPETYALRDRIEARYGIRLREVRGLSLAEQRAQYGESLWESAPDLCCDLRKVQPLEHALAGRCAWMTAVRRDQTDTRRQTPLLAWDQRRMVARIAPLARWNERDCWAYIRHHNLPYNPLHDREYPSIGCWPCTAAVRSGDDLRAGRWARHQKTECGLHLNNGRFERANAHAKPLGTPAMSTYPIILNGLETQPVLVVGGGSIAEAKVLGLLDAGAANVAVISPDLTEQLAALAVDGRISWQARPYRSQDIERTSPFLAIAATDDPRVNRQVAEEARRQRVLVNAVDDPPFCDFYAVSVVRQGRLTIGIGTDGQMPALAARLRQRLSRGFGPEYARLLELAAEFRPLIARCFPDFAQRRQVWYALADAAADSDAAARR